jgi:hypothetical protein
VWPLRNGFDEHIEAPGFQLGEGQAHTDLMLWPARSEQRGQVLLSSVGISAEFAIHEGNATRADGCQ